MDFTTCVVKKTSQKFLSLFNIQTEYNSYGSEIHGVIDDKYFSVLKRIVFITQFTWAIISRAFFFWSSVDVEMEKVLCQILSGLSLCLYSEMLINTLFLSPKLW